MLKFLIAFLLAATARADGHFSAVEYFEPVGPKIPRGATWPKRVTLTPVELSPAQYSIEGTWRLLFACSGRPLDGTELMTAKKQILNDGYRNAIGIFHFPAPDKNGYVWAERFEYSRDDQSGGEPLGRRIKTTFVFQLIEYRPGSIALVTDLEAPYEPGLIHQPFAIKEQEEQEIVFVGADAYASQLIRPFCRVGEVPETIYARVPEA